MTWPFVESARVFQPEPFNLKDSLVAAELPDIAKNVWRDIMGTWWGAEPYISFSTEASLYNSGISDFLQDTDFHSAWEVIHFNDKSLLAILVTATALQIQSGLISPAPIQPFTALVVQAVSDIPGNVIGIHCWVPF